MSPPHVQESTPSIADETTPDGVIPGNIRADATDIADDMTPVARECDNWRRQLIARVARIVTRGWKRRSRPVRGKTTWP
jgi:hypothetical protein